jgi:spore maturation protein SpmB
MHSTNTTAIFIPCIIATFVATLVGIIAVSIRQKINLFDRVIVAWLGGITVFIVTLVWYMHQFLNKEQIEIVSNVGSNLFIFFIPVLFLVVAMRKKVDVFGTFIEGAKNGFEVSVKIIPYLVALLVGIGVFRACGALDYIVDGFKWACIQLNIDGRFCDALPVALLKPLSGSGAKSMMISNMQHFGVDSFVGNMSAVMNGSADTTFYIVALYFGSVGIKNSRYAIPAGLIADLAGVIAAILVSYLFFG